MGLAQILINTNKYDPGFSGRFLDILDFYLNASASVIPRYFGKCKYICTQQFQEFSKHPNFCSGYFPCCFGLQKDKI
jgi:hypothetical protein